MIARNEQSVEGSCSLTLRSPSPEEAASASLLPAFRLSYKQEN